MHLLILAALTVLVVRVVVPPTRTVVVHEKDEE
jgi:hypothetical protein